MLSRAIRIDSCHALLLATFFSSSSSSLSPLGEGQIIDTPCVPQAQVSIGGDANHFLTPYAHTNSSKNAHKRVHSESYTTMHITYTRNTFERSVTGK